MEGYIIQLFKGTGLHPWHLRIIHPANPESPILSSEGYFSKWNAKRQAKKFGLPIVDTTVT